LLIFEKALTFIRDQLDVFRMVRRYDNRRACIAPYNSKMQFEYTMGREMLEGLGTEEGREFTEKCDWMNVWTGYTRLFFLLTQ